MNEGITYFWFNVFFLALGTIAIRFSIIALSARIRISENVKQIFSYIPAAILPALIAPSVFFHEGHVALVHGKERLVVLFLASLVCFFTRSTLATIGFGLTALFVLTQAG